MNFQDVKLSGGEEEGAEISNVHTCPFEMLREWVKPGHSRFNSATRKNHVRKIRARKLYVVKSREEREGGLNSFLLGNPVTTNETSNSSDPM